jgi:hypothetical protein
MARNRHRRGTPRCILSRLNGEVVAFPVIELAHELDLDGVPTCPLCLLDLAFEIKQGRTPSRALVKRTTDWVWMESGKAVKAALLQARMEERPFAEDALRDVELNGRHGRFAETVVWRLARELAEELP